MPGPYRNVLNVGEAYQDASKQQADILRSQAETQRLNMGTLLGKQEYDIQAKNQVARDQWQKWLTQQNLEGPVNRSNPNALPANPEQSQPSWWTPVDQSVVDLTKQRDQVGTQLQAANNLGMFDEVKILRPIYDNAVTRLREASNEQTKQREKNNEQTAQMLNGVKDEAGLNTAMQAVKQRFPPQVWKKADEMLLHKDDGSYLWNEQQAQRVDLMGKMYTSAAAQNTAAHQKETYALQQQQLEATKARDEERVRKDTADIAIKQAGAKRADEKFKADQQKREKDITLATARAERAKEPGSAEAKATGKYLETQLGMPPEIASKASYDYLRARADNIRSGMDKDDAEAEALATVTGKFMPGTKPSGGIFGFGQTPGTPPKYGDKPAEKTASPTVGVTPQTAPEGQTGTTPDGRKWIKKDGKWQQLQ